MTERDAARELWEHRNDPDEWSEEAENIEVRPRRASVLSFRLPSEELAALERAMEHSGESLSEFIRKALALRLHGVPIGPALEVAYGGPNELLVRRRVDESTAVTTAEDTGTTASYVPKGPQAEALNATAR
jgi:hypothetical protein